MIDDNKKISDTSITDITSQGRTNKISDDALTLTDSVDTPVELIEIPLEMYHNKQIKTQYPNEFKGLVENDAQINLDSERAGGYTPETQMITLIGDDGVISNYSITRCRSHPQAESICAI